MKGKNNLVARVKKVKKNDPRMYKNGRRLTPQIYTYITAYFHINSSC